MTASSPCASPNGCTSPILSMICKISAPKAVPPTRGSKPAPSKWSPTALSVPAPPPCLSLIPPTPPTGAGAKARGGPRGTQGLDAGATLEKRGARLAFGTDYPVEVVSPFRGLYACVTRQLPDGSPLGGWQPQEKISLQDCISAYTSVSAYTEF